MDQQADAPIEFGGDGGQGTGSFPADDLFRPPFPLGEPFEIPELFGFEPSGIAGYGCDGNTLLKKIE
ncbi:MAG: hypothetical protein AB7E77_10390 [Desulfobulbus sp.]